MLLSSLSVIHFEVNHFGLKPHSFMPIRRSLAEQRTQRIHAIRMSWMLLVKPSMHWESVLVQLNPGALIKWRFVYLQTETPREFHNHSSPVSQNISSIGQYQEEKHRDQANQHVFATVGSSVASSFSGLGGAWPICTRTFNIAMDHGQMKNWWIFFTPWN